MGLGALGAATLPPPHDGLVSIDSCGLVAPFNASWQRSPTARYYVGVPGPPLGGTPHEPCIQLHVSDFPANAQKGGDKYQHSCRIDARGRLQPNADPHGAQPYAEALLPQGWGVAAPAPATQGG